MVTNGLTHECSHILLLIQTNGQVTAKQLCDDCLARTIALLRKQPYRVISRDGNLGICQQCKTPSITLQTEMFIYYQEEMEHGKR